MRTTKEGVELIKKYEGFRPSKYLDKSGNLTIGYGHKILKKESFLNPLTQEQGLALLNNDIWEVERQVEDLLKPTRVNDNQFSALVCFTFNLGYRRLKDSYLLKAVEDGDLKAAALEFERWVFIGGSVSTWQVSRRTAERLLFQKAPRGNPLSKVDDQERIG